MAHDAIKSKLDEIRKKAAKAYEEEFPDPPEKLHPEIEMTFNAGSPEENVFYLPSIIHYRDYQIDLSHRERKRYLKMDKAGKLKFLNEKIESGEAYKPKGCFK